MKTSDFSYELPETLVARYPSGRRGDDRLMVLDRALRTRCHRRVADLPRLLRGGDLCVFNDSRVRKARLFARPLDSGGGEAEFLLVRRIDAESWQALTKHAKRRRVGSRYEFPGGLVGEITGEDGMFRTLRFALPVDDAWLDAHGHIPLPPYIKRADELSDAERYQTVYARESGSAAAPTAGLHFTREMLAELEAAGIETAFVTLHVGLGTFLPVRVENVEEHLMHEEAYTIGEEAAAKINGAKREGRRVIAVGTTCVRTLEAAWRNGALRAGQGATSIFIYPPYTFQAVDVLLTNFHTPQSSLLMLVSAFAGREFILESYAEAIQSGYRFFSYGDAMLIL